MRHCLYPYIRKADIVPIFICAAAGALLAGIYGVVHDQITFSLSPEYFTKFKFQQFGYADYGFTPRVFAAVIGVLSTWWLGLFVGWCFGRRYIANQTGEVAIKNIRKATIIVIGSALLFAIGGYLYGRVTDVSALERWSYIFASYDVVDGPSFMQAAYIHNASYAGAFVGLVGALIMVRPSRD